MDETQEDMPKLRELMTDDPDSYWPANNDLLEILREAPRRPQVVIRVTVTNELTGEIIENVVREDAKLWEGGYRQYFKTHRVIEAAEHVAARIAYDDDNKKGRMSG